MPPQATCFIGQVQAPALERPRHVAYVSLSVVAFGRSRAQEAGRRTRPMRFPSGLLVRSLVFGLVAIGGAYWALDRHYTHPLPPMRVPRVARPVPTYDADAGELPVPDWGASGAESPQSD